MVLITNTSNKFLHRRSGGGQMLGWPVGYTLDVDEAKEPQLGADLTESKQFEVHGEVSKADHLPQPIVGRRPRRPDPPEERQKLGEARPKRRRKAPSKGLKKKANDHPGMICGKAHPGMKHADWMADKKDKKGKKGIGIDLDGDGKVDVVVGGD